MVGLLNVFWRHDETSRPMRASLGFKLNLLVSRNHGCLLIGLGFSFILHQDGV